MNKDGLKAMQQKSDEPIKRYNDVLFFTFSDSGRRVSQNAGGGTDHGTAANLFFLSGLKQKA